MQRAFDKLGQQKSLSADISLDANADEIYAALKDTDDFERRDADLLEGLKLTSASAFDKPLKDVKSGDENGSGAFKLVKNDGRALVEVRRIGKKYYVRGDLKAFSELPSSKGRDDRAGIDELMRKVDELPSSMGAVKNAVKGKWVVLDADAFKELAEKRGKSRNGGRGEEEQLDPKSRQQLFDAVRKALGDNAEFKAAGKKDGADHVKVTVPAKKVAEDLAKALEPLRKKLGKDGKPSGAEDAPKKDVTVDVAIKNGMVSALTLDMSQLDEKVKGKLPVVIGLQGGAGGVMAPSGAQELKPQDLVAAMMRLAMDRMGERGSPDGADGLGI
ncbi:hypothetical protein [Streptomyces syringium]|uniref:hypothetical protein n=1 Tax=Streptomyces syringium TaxID=76729 RepID=UPI0034489078